MNCPACITKRRHEPSDWVEHPYAGHGFVKEQGWSHPDLSQVLAGADTSLRQNLGEIGSQRKRRRWEGRHDPRGDPRLRR